MNDCTQSKHELTRRDFLRVGATGATGIALTGINGLAVDAPAEKAPAGKLPRRRYGRTGLELSVLVGASDWSRDVRNGGAAVCQPGLFRRAHLPPGR